MLLPTCNVKWFLYCSNWKYRKTNSNSYLTQVWKAEEEAIKSYTFPLPNLYFQETFHLHVFPLHNHCYIVITRLLHIYYSVIIVLLCYYIISMLLLCYYACITLHSSTLCYPLLSYSLFVFCSISSPFLPFPLSVYFETTLIKFYVSPCLLLTFSS